METFNTIVSIASGVSVIIALLITLIKPIREKITHSKERDELYQRNFRSIKNELGKVEQDLVIVQNTMDKDKALRARTQILRFADEIYSKQKHTKEHFDEILDAMTYYNQYCDDHPEFKNFRTVNAQKVINHIYEQCQLEHTFLGNEKEELHEDQ